MQHTFSSGKINWKQEIKDFLFIISGVLLYALGVTGFIIPNEITTGGVTGISALVYYSTQIPVAVTYFCINIILLGIAIKIFGFKFTIKTVMTVLLMTLTLSLFQHHIQEPIVDNEPFMNCILGGILAGIGVGLVFNGKGSTGGTDIIALIINKYRNISVGRGILLCDVLIISASYILFFSVEKIVYGLVVMGVMSYTIDLIMNSARQSVQFFIFSSKYEEIADQINIQIDRGCTILDGIGWYSKTPTKVIVVIARKGESVPIFRLVKGIDPNAFISQSQVIGVFGEGFEQIK